MNARIFVVAGVVGVVACSGEPTSPDRSAPLAAAPTPITIASIQITPGSISLLATARRHLFATVTGSDGKVLLNPAITWTSSDPGIVSVAPMPNNGHPYSALMPAAVAFAWRAGTATITATVEGRLASVPVTVVLPTTDRSVVAIDSFFVIEFQYPSAPDSWFYAPKVRLEEKTGERSAEVLAVEFVLPGFGPAPRCSMSLRVGPGGAVDLFGESYGDYALTIDSPSVGRVAPGLAKAIITVRDDAGVVATLTATGPIVPGALPTTYTGGPSTPMTC